MGEQTRGLYDKINVLQSENESLRQQLREAEKKLALAIRPYEFEQLQAENLSLRQQLEEAKATRREAELQWEDMAERVTTAEQQLKRLREALRDCIDHAEEGWSYASDYFREKWGAEEGLAKARSALAELEKGEASFRRSKEAELPIRVSPEVQRNVGLRQAVEDEKELENDGGSG